MFFFYILYRASIINTLNDNIVNTANDKYWEISQQYHINSKDNSRTSICKSDMMKTLSFYAKIESDAYAVFKLGLVTVKRGRIIVTVVGLLLYCLYVVIVVRIRA